MPVTAVLFVIAAALYGAAAAAYLAFLVAGNDRVRRMATAILVGGFAVHCAEMSARGVAGLHPATSAREAIGFVAWLLVAAYLLANWKKPLGAVGAFVAPAGLALLLVARLSAVPGGATDGLGVLGRIHISLATAGVAVFALATAIAVVYLVQERQLKRKRIGQMVRKGAALETLDHLAHRCVQVGFPIFTVAMLTGAFWSARRAEGVRPEYMIAMVAWTAFAAALVTRTTIGWRGKRAAMMTIVGFTMSLIVLGIYLARRLVEA